MPRLKIWMQAVRAPFFTASLVPMFAGAALVLYKGAKADWMLLPLVLVCGLLFHAATNLINDPHDHARGVDKNNTFGSSRVIQEGKLTPGELRRGAALLFAAACGLSLLFLPVRGTITVLLLLTALAGGYLYTGGPIGYKYLALGDLMVFALMGPLMVIGAYIMLTGTVDADVFWVSVPIGLLVAAILHANNLRDIRHDREARVKTLANVLGFKAAKAVYVLLIGFAYLLTLGMITTALLPAWSLGVFAAFPLAVNNIRRVVSTPAPSTQALAAIDLKTAQLHLAFGALYLLGLLLGAFLR